MLSKEFFIEVVTEIRKHCARLDAIAEALGCGVCEYMYELPGLVVDYLEEQSGKEWPDEVFNDLYNNVHVSPEDLWDRIQALEEKKDD